MFEKLNTTIIGHVLAFWAVFLNHDIENYYGVSFAILSIACAYFHQNMYAVGTNHPGFAPILNLGTVLFMVVSYLLLLFSYFS